ncbi:zinc-dependent metalloprotease family protein [Yeosuana sp. MJ-SS3]|uniref:Zinc-dependent metalloprotease family protein n=1 Tax=Gilvirhabdus luticola TaxID=3079858 RepID=A0ABU3U8Q6_9FLAO|nr:zinc-dependent metalloprotease family protein [Yeosuana sp. MJ-SS3]MDU8886786.1 zinc-dependent metalloprotease family protein [Yeosuana sp. MJ-SS3]
MKNILLLKALCYTIFLSSFLIHAQTNNWIPKQNVSNVENLLNYNIDKDKTQFYELDFESLKQDLQGAPLRQLDNTSNNKISPSKTFVQIPVYDGVFETFRIYEAPVLAPELSAKYPQIKSYVGFSINNPSMRLRMSVSHLGVQTMVSFPNKPTLYMQPVSHGSKNHVSYNNYAKTTSEDVFECGTLDEIIHKNDSSNRALSNKAAEDQLLRKLRLAVSTNGEYTAYFGGTKAGALAGINASVSRANEVLETDVALTLEVVANTEDVIFLSAVTDPYPDSQGTWNSDVQTTLTSTIGEANYDIGHLFARLAGNGVIGNAGCIGCICVDNIKGSAWSRSGVPEGDNFDIQILSHELGHQLGATHTFSDVVEGAGTNSEPSTGSTIMSYAGNPPAVQSTADPYFHYHSLKQITDNFDNRTCWTSTPISNNPPNADAGKDYVIPQGTAYVLRGSAIDPDGGDTLMYCWEQTDNGQVTFANFGPTLTSGTMTRSLPPTTSSDRYIPNINRVVAGQLTEINPPSGGDWETVSTVARDLNWALTVRDREATAMGLGGQSSFDNMKITVVDGTPFTMTSQNTPGIKWDPGTEQVITWDVGETANEIINCQKINIRLSTDGGLTYPILLACDTPNDGSEPIVVPNNASAACRIMVEAADNIFFDISDADLQITSPKSASFLIDKSDLCASYEVCTNSNIDIDIDLNTIGAFAGTANFSVINLPTGVSSSFSPTSLSANGTTTMSLSNFGSAAPGEYILTVTGDSGAVTRDISLTLNVFGATISAPTLSSPINGAGGVWIKPELSWDLDVNATSYLLEIATDSGFSNIVQTSNTPFNSFTTDKLDTASTYYWRVTPSNTCATGTTSPTYSFTTVNLDCNPYTATDTPIAMGTSSPGTFESVITVAEDFSIADINVTIDISHTWVKELVITLTSPNGTDVILTDKHGNNSRPNLNYSVTVFDQEATTPIASGSPPFNGTFIPDGDLSTIYGEMSAGDWTLTVEDLEAGDGGSIDEFTIELCEDQPLSIENNTLTGFSVYPNPNRGEFNVRLNSTSGEAITINAYDIRGRKIYNNRFEQFGYFNEAIDLGQVQSGIYLIHVSDGLSTQVKKVIVK